MCPFLQQFSDAEQEHDRTCGIHISAQDGNTDCSCIQSRHFQSAFFQTRDPLLQIFQRTDTCPDRPYRCRYQKLPTKTHHDFHEQFFLIFCVHLPSGMLSQPLRHCHPIIPKLLPCLDDFPPVLFIIDHRILCSFIYFCFCHIFQVYEIIQQNIRLFKRHFRLHHMHPYSSRYFMLNYKLQSNPSFYLMPLLQNLCCLPLSLLLLLLLPAPELLLLLPSLH